MHTANACNEKSRDASVDLNACPSSCCIKLWCSTEMVVRIFSMGLAVAHALCRLHAAQRPGMQGVAAL